MTDDTPSRTLPNVTTPITADLAAAGFEDAVEVGRGGFAIVYLCWQAALDRSVAVKVLTSGLDADNKARFIREQRAMGRMTGHPNIVTILEAGTTAKGLPYLVMPYYRLGSLDRWIREKGPLSIENSLTLSVKIASALESAHALGIVHRDVKPGNILLTEHGEPALTDFGIAHVAGGFRTTASALTGSPAFMAPEVLNGDTPTSASDVYGLGATLFSALTGHAPFQRQSRENVVTQFLRITNRPVSNLQELGVPDDISALVETMMNPDRDRRPSAATLSRALRQAQQRHGFPSGAIVVQKYSFSARRKSKSGIRARPPLMAGREDAEDNLPWELTNFVNRRSEVAEIKSSLSTFRLVTLTGIGGVGKTRLALRAASSTKRGFAGGVWVVELADVDASLLVEVIAAALGIRDESTSPLLEVIIERVSANEILLVLDNCEHIIEDVAQLTETLLRTCPNLRILATSRERLNIAGEAVVAVSPLTVPSLNQRIPLQKLPHYHGVALFTDRAAAAAPGFELREDNKDAVARLCSRLDGLPLALELAAARLRTMSPEQILERLEDRYALLTRGSRTSPNRQQALRCSIDWSYELCTSTEQRLWSRLSIFGGSFELDDVEYVCGTDLASDPQTDERSLLDVLSSLLDKSIIIREGTNDVARYRLLETIREYGHEKLCESGEENDLRRRHRDWYQQLAMDSEAGWVSDRQPYWIARLERELPNLREAIEFCLSEETEEAVEVGLSTVAALMEFWSFRGLYGEGRAWLDRLLASPRAASLPTRIKALGVACLFAAVQGDFESAGAFLQESQSLTRSTPTAIAEAHVAFADGFLALAQGRPNHACSSFEHVIALLHSAGTAYLHMRALTLLGWALEVSGELEEALKHYQHVRSITQARGESLYRSIALRGMGVALWQRGEPDHARGLLEEALRVGWRLKSPSTIALNLEALAWMGGPSDSAERAAVLMGAARGLWPVGSSATTVLPNMSRFHDESEQKTRRVLGSRKFEAALRRGQNMDMSVAVAYALGEQASDAPYASNSPRKLTKRERQVAELIAHGMSNKQIAAKLVISQRTAEGHVEHILNKLGFTSRAQVAVWIAEKGNNLLPDRGIAADRR
jgi:non-specific serine/threonine protein kinase